MDIKQDPFEGELSLEDVQSLQKAQAPSDQTQQAAPEDIDPEALIAQKKDGVTLTGEPADKVVVDPNLPDNVNESADSTAVMAFGRYNPPTVGHEKLIHKVEDEAKSRGGHAHIIASHSEGTSKNPVPQDKKIGYLKKVAKSTTTVSGSSKEHPSILHAAANLYKAGHQHLVVVAGSDRVKEYHDTLHKYNNVASKHGHYNFKSIHVVSAGQRDPDAEGAEGMSGTKMRQLAHEGKHKEFKAGLPKALHPHAKEIGDHIRAVKEEVELEEGIGLQQRLRRAVTMRKNSAKISRARDIARKRLAKQKNIHRRSLKRARTMVRQRLAGQRGKDYAHLSTSEKIAIDKMADKRKAQIKRIAARISSRIKRDEIQRLASVTRGKKVKNSNIPMVEQLTEKAAAALRNKAEKSGVELTTLVGVYARGLDVYESNDRLTPQQAAFSRVNSYLAKGKAYEEDADIREASQEQLRKAMATYGIKTARHMDAHDIDHVKPVMPFAQHTKHVADIKKEKDTAARKKADLVRRAVGQFQSKIIEARDQNSVYMRVANRLVKSKSPQLANLHKDIVNALKSRDYNAIANILVYLSKDKLSKQSRIMQEDVCVPEEDYIYEEWTEEQWNTLVEENNEGRKLNKPFRTPGGPKKFAVYVKNDKGNIIKLGFGDPNLEIKRDDPERRKAYRARHGCDNPGPKWKANYWSCNWSWSSSKKVGA